MSDLLRERAEHLLKVHRGSCSVVETHELVPAFEAMRDEQLVKIERVPVTGVLQGYLTIRKKGFRIVHLKVPDPPEKI